MSDNILNSESITDIIESALIAIGLISLAIIKLMSYCEKRRTNREQIALLRAQAAFNNNIEIETIDEESVSNLNRNLDKKKKNTYSEENVIDSF